MNGAAPAGIIPPEQEEDLSGAGWKVPRTPWVITSVEESPASDKNGSGIRATIEYTAEVEGRTFNVKERIWKSHTDKATSDRAAGDRKRLYTAVFGGPKGALTATTLLGKTLSAEGYEDAQGFRRLRGHRAVAAGFAASGAASPAVSTAGL